jgi:two-component system sensor histidine kinase KdpD
VRLTLAPRRPVLLARRRRLGGWLVLAAGLPLLTVVLVSNGPEGLAVGLLLYLGIVLAAGAIGGLGPGLVGALASAALANYFIVPPVHRLTIDKATDLVALMIFVAVAVTVSTLVNRSARLSAEAARARAEAEALAGSTATLVAEVDPLPALLTQLRTTLGLDAVGIFTPSPSGWIELASAGGPIGTPDEVDVTALGSPDGPVLAVREGTPLSGADRGLLRALTGHLALAISARELQTEAARAAALEQADALRTAILQAVSHDLRTPLSSIKAAVTSLLGDEVEWSADAVRQFHTTIDAEADRLDRLVGNLLDMSRLQAGALELRLGPVALDDIVGSALASLSDTSTPVDIDIPDATPLAHADAALLERAVANLLANAFAHSRPGTSVLVEAGGAGAETVLRIVDHGPGVAPEQMASMVEPFQRLGDTSTHAGVGLGLAVANGFVTAMGGHLRFETTRGGGLTASIVLPSEPRRDVAPAQRSAS